MRRFTVLLLALAGCVGEDIVMDEVDPEVRITNSITTMEIGTTWQFEYMFLNNVGVEEEPDQISWSTSDASVAIINQDGLATALDYGEVMITLSVEYLGEEVETTIPFEVTDDPTSSSQQNRQGTIMTTSSYDLTGDFNIEVDGNELVISFDENYIADQGLPGLYVYLTNNPNTPNGGYEIGPVEVFSGTHEYRIPDVDLFDYDYLFYYCKPFEVKVGQGEIE
ncbi:MAG: Ig-like domain-containing protein [Ekhidna sp.]|uniref:Ig-like domain-containing protein n=1 Tax=Ekhidna sp. TaxID=2608089 RepID=UPI0032EB4691